MKARMFWPYLIALAFPLFISLNLVGHAAPSNFAPYDCEGNACSVVTLTWDEERQQFKVQNDSNQQVKVEVNTFAGASVVRVLPHNVEYLEVKTFNGPYNANYE
jgi:hypothetical protein